MSHPFSEILSIDIETKSLTSDKEDALIFHKNKILCIGVVGDSKRKVYRDLISFKKEIWDNPKYVFSGHNFKWDFKVLVHHLGELPARGYEAYFDDTRILAYVCTDKIPQKWLIQYEIERVKRNAELPSGFNHRVAGQHSLKTLAPYFLNVPGFWEDPTEHDSDAYVLKDCLYSQNLRNFFYERMSKLEQLDFYVNKMMPWARMLLKAEIEGVKIDLGALETLEIGTLKNLQQLKESLGVFWKEGFENYKKQKTKEIKEKYEEMLNTAKLKTSKKSKDIEALTIRYSGLYEKALLRGVGQFNIDSPAQLSWLFKSNFGWDIQNLEGKDSTGVEVLERLAKTEVSVKTLLEYRKNSKIATSYIPAYKTLQYRGRIHCNFNPDGTRTGRLSSSLPNLQQVSDNLKHLFISDANTKFSVLDLGAIEPAILAFFSNDKELCDLILKGQSFHSLNAIEMFKLDCEEKEVKNLYPDFRYIAKQVGLSILYGAGWRMVQMIGDGYGYRFDEKACKKMVYGLRDKYSGVWNFKLELDKELETGVVLFNLFGRPFKFDDPEEVYMKGLNRLIQGSASDLTLQSAYDIGQIEGCSPLMLIHDSIVTRISKEESHKRISHEFTKYELMTEYGKIPLTVEGGIYNEWR